MARSLMEEMVYQVRTGFKKSDDVRDAGLTTPDTVIRFDDIPYGPNAKEQSLDVYRPKSSPLDQKLPVIVSIHGGGWVYGDKELYQFYCMSLAEFGFTVINFTYRLAPETKFPASIHDTNSVFTWLMEHSEEYGFDTDHIYAVGDSAGAHGLGIYSNLVTNPAFLQDFQKWERDSEIELLTPPKGLSLKGIALNCGQYNIDLEHANEMTKGLMQAYLPKGGSKEELHLVDVAGNVTEHFPPTFLMTATGDFLIDQAPFMAQTLMKQKVPFEFHFYHGFDEKDLGHVFHLNMKKHEAHVCNQEETDFFLSKK